MQDRELTYSMMAIVNTVLNTGNFLRVDFRYSHHKGIFTSLTVVIISLCIIKSCCTP